MALPKYNKEKPDSKTVSSDMNHVHELIKHSKSNASMALPALTSDPNASKLVFVAENTHRRLLKMGEEEQAKKYFAKAAEIYHYSTYFEGSKKDLK